MNKSANKTWLSLHEQKRRTLSGSDRQLSAYFVEKSNGNNFGWS